MKKHKVLKIVGIIYLMIGLALILPLSLTAKGAYTGTNPVFMTGTQVKAYSFSIWKQGSTYYATNGLTGAVDYSGTNATAIFESCIVDDTNIFVKEATYFFDSQLYIDENNVNIEFETGTSLNFTGSFSPCILLNTSLWVTFKGLNTVIFNDGGATNRVMISLQGSDYNHFEGLYIHGLNATGVVGIELYAPNGDGNTLNEFIEIKLWRCDTGILFNYTGSGWNNRNHFLNVYAYLGTSYGLRLIGFVSSGNSFIACEFGHSDIGVSYESQSSGGNNFIGCTWDTNDVIAIDKPYTTHRSMKVLGATIWHTGSSDAINGTWQYGDHFEGVTGDHYSNFNGNATIPNGSTSVVVSYNAWDTPYHISITPLATYEGKAVYVSSKNSTHMTVSLSSIQGTDLLFNYAVYAFP